jgi:hypothetical protein
MQNDVSLQNRVILTFQIIAWQNLFQLYPGLRYMVMRKRFRGGYFARSTRQPKDMPSGALPQRGAAEVALLRVNPLSRERGHEVPARQRFSG